MRINWSNSFSAVNHFLCEDNLKAAQYLSRLLLNRNDHDQYLFDDEIELLLAIVDADTIEDCYKV